MIEAQIFITENRDTLWMESIRPEMKDICIAFELHEGKTYQLVGFKDITDHLALDVNFEENFRLKARHCAVVIHPMYLHLSLTLRWFNVNLNTQCYYLNVLSGNVQNVYLTTPNCEKVWVRVREDFRLVTRCEE